MTLSKNKLPWTFSDSLISILFPEEGPQLVLGFKRSLPPWIGTSIRAKAPSIHTTSRASNAPAGIAHPLRLLPMSILRMTLLSCRTLPKPVFQHTLWANPKRLRHQSQGRPSCISFRFFPAILSLSGSDFNPDTEDVPPWLKSHAQASVLLGSWRETGDEGLGDPSQPHASLFRSS